MSDVVRVLGENPEEVKGEYWRILRFLAELNRITEIKLGDTELERIAYTISGGR